MTLHLLNVETSRIEIMKLLRRSYIKFHEEVKLNTKRYQTKINLK